MASIQVTQASRTEVIVANRDLLVTVSVIGQAFSVYAYIPEQAIDLKVVHGESRTFMILRNEHVEIESMGTGVIEVTTVNAP